jgi:hypothetical protein
MTPSAVLLVVLCALFATAIVALEDGPVKLHNGFTVITSSSGLWAFTNQTGLTTFKPQYKVALPFNALPLNQTAVAGTAGGVGEGGFIVISRTAVALGGAAGANGEQPTAYQVIHQFSPLNFTLMDVSFASGSPVSLSSPAPTTTINTTINTTTTSTLSASTCTAA